MVDIGGGGVIPDNGDTYHQRLHNQGSHLDSVLWRGTGGGASSPPPHITLACLQVITIMKNSCAMKCRATHLERFADQRLARYINFCSWHLLLASVVVVELLCNVLFTNGCTNWLLALDPTNIVVSGGLGF